MNLYEISQQYYWLASCDDLTDELKQKLDECVDNFENKCFSIGKLVKNVETDVVALELEIDALKERLVSKKRKITSLTSYLKSGMESCRRDKISYALFDIKIKKNPCKVMIDPEIELPEEYIKEKITVNIDRDLIKMHLKNGVVIPGCELIQDTRLDIS